MLYNLRKNNGNMTSSSIQQRNVLFSSSMKYRNVITSTGVRHRNTITSTSVKSKLIDNVKSHKQLYINAK